MAIRKLTPTEIKKTVEKIRKKYDEYNYKYFKSRLYKHEFEKRYLKALKDKVDISSFLLAEISAIEELNRREEEKVLQKKLKNQKKSEKSFADKVLEDNRKRIEKYDDVLFHQDANEEIRRLFGALNILEQEYWTPLYSILKNTLYSMNSKRMMALETQLHALGGTGKEGIPPRLERYVTRLNRFPRDYNVIDKEEKDYIVEAALFLHEIREILENVQEKYDNMEEADKNKLGEIKNYIRDLISDFRLKDLKKKY